MTSPDKFAAAGKQQLATQLDFFQALTARAFDHAERILALNIQTARTTLDQTSGVMRQLATARDPRDLLALGAQSQQHVETAIAYSRKLFEIANKPAVPPAEAPAPAAEHIVTAPPVSVAEPLVAEPVAAAPVAATVPAPATEPSVHPLGEADPEPTPALTAKAKPIAKAASKVAAAPLDVPHPAASPMPEAGPIIIPPIAPVDAVAEPSSPQPKRGSGKGAKKR